ncbi:MAG: 3-deoxy-7-phosphoheptulonate synthase, partial [Methylocystaceae bacterium]
MKPYHLAEKKENQLYTDILIPKGKEQHAINSQTFTVIAGPCAVENRDAYLEEAECLKKMGVHILRGGAYKPRTSPYSFMGLEEEGISILAEARKFTGLPVVTEVMDIRHLDPIMAVADILQVGSRNMQNYPLLMELGKIDKPVLIKRGFAATIEEWLLAAEYILNQGNSKVVLCERGIRTFEVATRNTVDLGGVALLKELSHLPVLVDPSHATGRWQLVIPVARAALAVGADGIMVEVHPNPEHALSDGKQSLNYEH